MPSIKGILHKHNIVYLNEKTNKKNRKKNQQHIRRLSGQKVTKEIRNIKKYREKYITHIFRCMQKCVETKKGLKMWLIL
jgi:hypothetical protein